MAKAWVLETHTKGTGANMVPLDKPQDARAGTKEPQFAVPKPRERTDEPAPKPPARFRVVDVMTGRVLVDGAGTRATVDALGDVRSVVDVSVHVWNHHDERWRLLTQREQRMLWGHRPAATA